MQVMNPENVQDRPMQPLLRGFERSTEDKCSQIPSKHDVGCGNSVQELSTASYLRNFDPSSSEVVTRKRLHRNEFRELTTESHKNHTADKGEKRHCTPEETRPKLQSVASPAKEARLPNFANKPKAKKNPSTYSMQQDVQNMVFGLIPIQFPQWTPDGAGLHLPTTTQTGYLRSLLEADKRPPCREPVKRSRPIPTAEEIYRREEGKRKLNLIKSQLPSTFYPDDWEKNRVNVPRRIDETDDEWDQDEDVRLSCLQPQLEGSNLRNNDIRLH